MESCMSGAARGKSNTLCHSRVGVMMTDRKDGPEFEPHIHERVLPCRPSEYLHRSHSPPGQEDPLNTTLVHLRLSPSLISRINWIR